MDDQLLKATGTSGVIHKGDGVQIIYGPRVTVIKSNLEDYISASIEKKTNDLQMKNNKETIIIGSPVNGVAAELSETPDEAFAKKMMGDGAVVRPTDGKVYAPENGEVCFVFETKHAIGFLTDTGISMLMHMGIDTMKLNGKGFKVFVKQGQKVKKGDLLMQMDLAYIKENAASDVSPILCTELNENQKVRLITVGDIKAGAPLLAIDFMNNQ